MNSQQKAALEKILMILALGILVKLRVLKDINVKVDAEKLLEHKEDK